MNAYAAPAPDILRPLTSADICTLFGKAEGWFDRHRVRARLYRKGFPHPMERGLWSPKAVADWFASAGSNPDHVPPRAARQRPAPRRNRSNGYAPIGRPH